MRNENKYIHTFVNLHSEPICPARYRAYEEKTSGGVSLISRFVESEKNHKK